jgi:hypothetical protein
MTGFGGSTSGGNGPGLPGGTPGGGGGGWGTGSCGEGPGSPDVFLDGMCHLLACWRRMVVKVANPVSADTGPNPKAGGNRSLHRKFFCWRQALRRRLLAVQDAGPKQARNEVDRGKHHADRKNDEHTPAKNALPRLLRAQHRTGFLLC